MYGKGVVSGGVLGPCSGGRGAVSGHGGMSAAHGIDGQSRDELGGRDDAEGPGGHAWGRGQARAGRELMASRPHGQHSPIWALTAIAEYPVGNLLFNGISNTHILFWDRHTVPEYSKKCCTYRVLSCLLQI